MVRAYLVVGDTLAAHTMLREAEEFLVFVPDAPRVKDQLAGLMRELQSRAGEVVGGHSSLTTAELWILHYLPAQLTLAEIADRLRVSPNTVKSHVSAIYRKLGVPSRGAAVAAAAAAGLLDVTARDPEAEPATPPARRR
jgi:LuxR family maltose regulon positive regulatory protein